MTEPHEQHDESTNGDERRPYRPPVGMPLRGEGRWGAPFSLVVHVILILVLVTPVFARVVAPELFPGGGPGPAGGGGGGTGGIGGWRPAPITPEGLRYVRVAPEPPPQETAEAQTEPVPKEEETPPPPPEPEPAVEEAAPEARPQAAAPVPGSEGGTGNDGTSGTGPGTGGGTGSGVGTGTGSGDGPGTGGGEGRDHLPTPELVLIPPQPPGRLKGTVIPVTFTLDERGEILRVDFPSTGDRGYDRRLREALNEMRFRPAVGLDGRPIAAKYPVEVRL
jgi:protein TonB